MCGRPSPFNGPDGYIKVAGTLVKFGCSQQDHIVMQVQLSGHPGNNFYRPSSVEKVRGGEVSDWVGDGLDRGPTEKRARAFLCCFVAVAELKVQQAFQRRRYDSDVR
ncbi:Uncharacterised protein [Mycolicibacterium gilvum]|uniref:Uncharacterized protein n=1 Tax=Mycolicibacterium gilvum TaxID=1804 RepID=A0A379MQ68_9MYCO|nr:Uncharacterised protein [Mycolicibacterium gilvum]